MMTSLRHALAAAVIVALAVPIAYATGPASSTTSNLVCAEATVASWTTRQLASETIVVPVDASQVATMVPAARAGYGGLIVFGTVAPAGFVAGLKAVQAVVPHGLSMMVMTDEEGGGVQRLTNLTPSIPWAQTMGRTLTAYQIQALGLRVGRALARAGVNVDLAPVLDVDGRRVGPSAANPDGMRSFSGSPSAAAVDGTAFMTGLALGGVTSVVKHFPGLGGSNGNTDYGPAHTMSWSALQTTGLVAFSYAVGHGATAIMLSNASVPGLTSLPAGISPAVVKVLRETLGFTGLIVTDSLSAGAMSARHLSVPAAGVAALQAGADQLLFGIPRPPLTSMSLSNLVVRAIIAAVTAGTLTRATLATAAAQVLAVRNVVACPPSTTTTL